MDFALDPATGDLSVVNGEIQFVRGADAIRQHLQIRLGIAKGEWYQDLRVGVPLYERILGGKDIATIVAIYRRVIATTPGVISVVQLEHVYNAGTRALEVFGEARTTEGTIVFDHSEFIE